MYHFIMNEESGQARTGEGKPTLLSQAAFPQKAPPRPTVSPEGLHSQLLEVPRSSWVSETLGPRISASAVISHLERHELRSPS